MERLRLVSGATAFLYLWVVSAATYAPGDFVPLARRGQYHSARTTWHDQLGRHCPRFGIDREVVLPVPKPQEYTGADSYKISFQVGKEKFSTPWLLVVGRQNSEVPIIDFTLRYSGGDLQGVIAKVTTMPEQYIKDHDEIQKQFLDPQAWPKHVLVRYTWEETSEFDVEGGLYVLFGSGKLVCLHLACFSWLYFCSRLPIFISDQATRQLQDSSSCLLLLFMFFSHPRKN
ncbi:hypothetical protein O6H91_13G089300 [Diphasiastrum complanatum]|uniref:Uncharacterized protein n=2 Tax=Diphasiastrum complanatum TaxID=34168 RepID=A0ACC2BX28_DIPCM|nr:hypothetical protein O6H91_13G089300 [Diphasiastrum complanatum]KAJ7534317.1 hypothetical protein O6H91_13G089300 [Diphasiastrum complanatum]